MSADNRPGAEAEPDTPTAPSTPDTDDIKAKFRAALRHKEHHEGPDVSAGGEGKHLDTPHGAPPTKREFRRKTG